MRSRTTSQSRSLSAAAASCSSRTVALGVAQAVVQHADVVAQRERPVVRAVVHRPVERLAAVGERRLPGLEHLLDGQPRRLGDLGGRGAAAQLPQLRLDRVLDDGGVVADVARDPQHPGAVAEVALELAEDGRDRERAERRAARGIEAIDGLDETEPGDLLEVLERLAACACSGGRAPRRGARTARPGSRAPPGRRPPSASTAVPRRPSAASRRVLVQAPPITHARVGGLTVVSAHGATDPRVGRGHGDPVDTRDARPADRPRRAGDARRPDAQPRGARHPRRAAGRAAARRSAAAPARRAGGLRPRRRPCRAPASARARRSGPAPPPRARAGGSRAAPGRRPWPPRAPGAR